MVKYFKHYFEMHYAKMHDSGIMKLEILNNVEALVKIQNKVLSGRFRFVKLNFLLLTKCKNLPFNK